MPAILPVPPQGTEIDQKARNADDKPISQSAISESNHLWRENQVKIFADAWCQSRI